MQKTSLSAARLFRDLRFIMAKRYMDDPAISIVRGQIAKAELGQYPGRAPYGYSHDPQNRRIVPHPTKADVVRSIFRLYALRSCSAAELRKTVAGETRTWIAKSQLFRILRSSFYVGHFTWGGREFSGTHEPLVDPVTFARVQEIISRGKRNRSK
jgi:site-specific DNA recombinase